MTQTIPSSKQPWPPPPDLDSLKELLATADIEGFIANDRAPVDEYDTEAEVLFDRVRGRQTEELTASNLLPTLEAIWRESFSLDDPELGRRRETLAALAAEIERFFGPQATPHVRRN